MRFRRLRERIISDKLPKHREKVKMPSAELAEGLKEFCDKYLQAAMELKIESLFSGYLNISDEYAAYTVKLMVKYAPVDKMLRVSVKGDDFLVIEAEYPDGLPGLDATAEIFAAARNAGFEADFCRNTIILKAAYIDPKLATLHSSSYRRFFSSLEEIFFG